METTGVCGPCSGLRASPSEGVVPEMPCDNRKEVQHTSMTPNTFGRVSHFDMGVALGFPFISRWV